MNLLRYFIVSMLCLGIYSCECEKNYSCGSISVEATSWLPQNLQDTIRFANAQGVEIEFAVFNSHSSEPYEAAGCIRTGLGFCQCDRSCEATSWFKANTSYSIANLNTYGVSIVEHSNNDTQVSTSTLEYEIFDFVNEINIAHPTELKVGDSLLPSLQLGGINYQDVYVQTLDTLSSNNLNLQVWKAYFTKSNGLIGFHERQSHSLFYRE